VIIQENRGRTVWPSILRLSLDSLDSQSPRPRHTIKLSNASSFVHLYIVLVYVYLCYKLCGKFELCLWGTHEIRSIPHPRNLNRVECLSAGSSRFRSLAASKQQSVG